MNPKPENAITRRRVLQLCGLGLLAGGSGLNLLGCECSSSVPLAPKGSWRTETGNLILSLSEIEKLQPVGGAVRVPLEISDPPAKQVIVAHISADEYLAFLNKCTHKGRGLDYHHSSAQIECCTGHSRFDLQGRVIDGNAEEDLTVYPTVLDQDRLIIEVG
jgi:nitrite reductase/ring-hydroxylating ferredoxin subunit